MTADSAGGALRAGPPTAADVEAALAEVADPERAAGVASFFKSGVGEYGEGDRFLGIPVPVLRKVAKRYGTLARGQITMLLASEWHEVRFVGLAILVGQYSRAQSETTELYVELVRAGRVNNWDLVDSTAEFVLGEYLLDRPRDLLFELAASPSLWERRVGIISTFGFIKHGDASTTLELSKVLLGDTHDLMHKAVGWMLREVGKRVDRELLIGFLDENAARMPRTALSYATEHLTPELRAHYRGLR